MQPSLAGPTWQCLTRLISLIKLDTHSANKQSTNIYNMPGTYMNTWPIILANMFVQITATTEFLTAAYLSFKANKYTT